MTPEAQLTTLGLTLPPPPPRGGVYKPVVIVGNVAYVSGHGPYRGPDDYICGRVGADMSLEEGKAAARQVGLAMLATLKSELGSLDRVKRVVKLLGMVNAVPGFRDHPRVIDGCSELLVDLFGEDGLHARSAVGMGSLPMNIPVEIEAIVAVRD